MSRVRLPASATSSPVRTEAPVPCWLLRGNKPQVRRSRARARVQLSKDLLEVRTREEMPAAWARTQNNLAMALKSLGALRKDMAVLAEARAAVLLALEVAPDDENYKDTLQQIDAAIAELANGGSAQT